MKAIIVENEREGRESLLLKLQKHCPEVEVVAACDTGETAVKNIREYRPALVFLDIRLGNMTGFEVLEQVQPFDFGVIFTTAYEEYAIQAIRLSPIDYLIKPIRPNELQDAVYLAGERIADRAIKSRMVLPDGSGYRIIHISDVLYCLADNVNTEIHFINPAESRFLVVRTLRAIHALLPSNKFYRISRSVVVNIDCIRNVYRSDGGYLVLDTPNREEFGISRSRMDGLLHLLGKE